MLLPSFSVVDPIMDDLKRNPVFINSARCVMVLSLKVSFMAWMMVHHMVSSGVEQWSKSVEMTLRVPSSHIDITATSTTTTRDGDVQLGGFGRGVSLPPIPGRKCLVRTSQRRSSIGSWDMSLRTTSRSLPSGCFTSSWTLVRPCRWSCTPRLSWCIMWSIGVGSDTRSVLTPGPSPTAASFGCAS